MARDQNEDANRRKKNVGTAESAGCVRLGENGLPQTLATPEEKDAANRTKVTVRNTLKRGPQKAG